MNENYVFSLYYTKKIKADLMFLDVGNVETYERILSKLNEMHVMKFSFFILKQTNIKHGLIVEYTIVACSYANETKAFHVDIKISMRDITSIIIPNKN